MVQVQVVAPAELSLAERASWRAFRAGRPELASPFSDLRYTLVAGEVAPNAAIAVIRRRGETIGFLPFQRRDGQAQPLGAPLTTHYGLIAAPGETIALAEVLRALGTEHAPFEGLTDERDHRVFKLHPRAAIGADISAGFEVYLAQRVDRGQGALPKDGKWSRQALEREHGELDFSFTADPRETLVSIARLKRDHLRRAGQTDIFACDWTVALLRRLARAAEPDFGVRFATLSAGGRLIAAEAGLLSGHCYHLWLPVYDPDFARYSPAALMTLETLKLLPALGVRTADFGPGDEACKGLIADAQAA